MENSKHLLAILI